MKKTFVKVLNIVVDVLVVFVLIISVLILAIVLTEQGPGKVPSLFGKAPLFVETPSMEKTLMVDDLIISDVVDHSVNNEYKVGADGDIVSFRAEITDPNTNLKKEAVLTHRLYKKNKDGTYLTKGDNKKTNPTYDQDPNNTDSIPNLNSGDILAVYHGTRIPALGAALRTLKTPTGFLIIWIPMIIFFLYQAVRVVINLMAYNKEKAIAEARKAIVNADLTDEQKQRAIEEFLAAQKAEESGGTDETEAAKEAPSEAEDSAEEDSEAEAEEIKEAAPEEDA